MKRLKLYLLINDPEALTRPWEYYASCIVAASSGIKAKSISPHPDAKVWPHDRLKIKIQYIGTAKAGTRPGIIHKSFISA